MCCKKTADKHYYWYRNTSVGWGQSPVAQMLSKPTNSSTVFWSHTEPALMLLARTGQPQTSPVLTSRARKDLVLQSCVYCVVAFRPRFIHLYSFSWEWVLYNEIFSAFTPFYCEEIEQMPDRRSSKLFSPDLPFQSRAEGGKRRRWAETLKSVCLRVKWNPVKSRNSEFGLYFF